MTTIEQRLKEAYSILEELGLPRPQLNERTALCLLALLNLTPDKKWSSSDSPLMGITPIIDWVKKHYHKVYAPNTRETFRRHSMHQFIQATIALYNPDKPDRPVNSPYAVYQIEPNLLRVLRLFGSQNFKASFTDYFRVRKKLADQYAKEREMAKIPIKIKSDFEIRLSSGEHSRLIKNIVEDFAPRFVPGGHLIYIGDTGN